MNQKILFAGTIALSATAAFLIGRNSAQPEETSPEAAQTPPARENRPSSLRSSDASPSRATSASRSERLRNNSSSGWMRNMNSILQSNDPLDRAQAWLDFINTLDPDQFQSVVDQFRKDGFTRNNMTEYSMLLTAWARANPFEALEYASENTGTNFARNTILTEWASSDPNSAIQWAQDNHEGDDANPWMVGVIRGIASSDPALATSLMSEMPYSDERGRALNALLPSILAEGPDHAREWVSNIQDERLQQGAISRLAEELARTDPLGTADWLVENSGDGANRSMDNVISKLAETDLDAAKDYFQSMESGALRTSALRGITNTLALSNPQAAASLLDTYPEDTSDRIYQQFVWNSFRQEPNIAADYIGRIEDTRRRDSTYRRMLDGWMRRDFDAASTWISSNELPESISNRMTRRMNEIAAERE